MLEICRTFGGELDLQKAKEIEEAMKRCDLEVGDDLIESVLQSACQSGQADYVGYLVGYCTEAIAEDFKEAIADAGFGEFIVNTCTYPNYLNSSGEITIDFEPEELVEASKEEIERLREELEGVHEFYSDLLDEARISVEVKVGDYEADIEDFISLLSEVPEKPEDRKAFFREEGILTVEEE